MISQPHFPSCRHVCKCTWLCVHTRVHVNACVVQRSLFVGGALYSQQGRTLHWCWCWGGFEGPYLGA